MMSANSPLFSRVQFKTISTDFLPTIGPKQTAGPRSSTCGVYLVTLLQLNTNIKLKTKLLRLETTEVNKELETINKAPIEHAHSLGFQM